MYKQSEVALRLFISTWERLEIMQVGDLAWTTQTLKRRQRNHVRSTMEDVEKTLQRLSRTGETKLSFSGQQLAVFVSRKQSEAPRRRGAIWTKLGPHADPQWVLVPAINELLFPNNECSSVFIVALFWFFLYMETAYRCDVSTKTRPFSKLLKLVETSTRSCYCVFKSGHFIQWKWRVLENKNSRIKPVALNGKSDVYRKVLRKKNAKMDLSPGTFTLVWLIG